MIKGTAEHKRWSYEWNLKNIPQAFDQSAAVNLFTYRPRPGDRWEVRLPGKRMIRKDVGRISSIWMSRKDDGDVRRPYVHWYRLSKGRYSGIRVKWLLKYGTLKLRMLTEGEIEIKMKEWDKENAGKN